MKLELEVYGSLCATSVFTINGVDAEYQDFGHKYDADPEDAEEYGCGNMIFEPGYFSEGIGDKYGINEDEFKIICEKLEEKLSFGSCGWCGKRVWRLEFTFKELLERIDLDDLHDMIVHDFHLTDDEKRRLAIAVTENCLKECYMPIHYFLVTDAMNLCKKYLDDLSEETRKKTEDLVLECDRRKLSPAVYTGISVLYEQDDESYKRYGGAVNYGLSGTLDVVRRFADKVEGNYKKFLLEYFEENLI